MRPNIVLFHCHDLGRHVGCYGIPTVQTSCIDAFAAEGAKFTNSFCVAPQCSPSRAALFTGKYPHNNGVMGLTHSPFHWELNPSEKHVAQQLQDVGYHTISIGVMHETQLPGKRWGFNQRVDLREEAARADVVGTETIAILEQLRKSNSQPFFICTGSYEPHRLFAPTNKQTTHLGFVSDYVQSDTRLGVTVPPFLVDDDEAKEEFAEYQGAIHFVDQQFGRILDALDKNGFRENTLVIFTTDHGIPFPRAKCSCYDPGLETAFILRLPSRPGWYGGRTVDALISHVDFMPSICELTGAQLPKNVQGLSWVPLLDQGNTNETYNPHTALFSEMTYHDYYDPIRAVRTSRYKLIAFFSAAPHFMSPTQSWKPRTISRFPLHPPLAYHSNFELYDLSRDPLEQHNLFYESSYHEIREKLLGMLAEHLISTEDPILQGPIPSPMHEETVESLLKGAVRRS